MVSIKKSLTGASVIGAIRKNVRWMTQEQWAAEWEASSDEEGEHLLGSSPGGAAADLGVTRQRIHQLLSEGKLDGIRINDEKGRLMAFFVTKASVNRYKATNRKPGPKSTWVDE